MLYGAETIDTNGAIRTMDIGEQDEDAAGMCRVTRNDKIRDEHIQGTGVAQVSKTITERRLNWYEYVMM